ncbi:MAG: CHAD domain-containing protein [Gemmatimonadota bacterium]
MKGFRFDDGPTAALPAKRGIRLIALELLDRADSAFGRVSQPSDPAALHDFRVSLRRLRSHVRSYRPWLRESVDRKHERRIRRIARASNDSRDYEVQLDRLREIEPANDVEERARGNLESHFFEGMTEAAREFRSEALHDYPALSRELRIGFASYRAELRTDGGHEQQLARVAARLAARLRDELQDHLGAVLSIEHQDEAHDARIAGKKLRYLLEPFQLECGPCVDAVDAMKDLQDALGHLHDLHLLLAALEDAISDADLPDQSMFAALRERVSQRRSEVYDEVKFGYLDSSAALVVDHARLAERALRQVKSHHEIERKYLLKRMPRVKHAQQLLIRQGYLPGEDIQERVRSVQDDGGRKYYRTFKSVQGVRRIEIEEETTEKMFKQLFALTKGQRIRKRRYVVQENGARWEIDRFLDRKLVLAEIELDSPDDPVELPRWLAALVVREVTDDPEYTNAKLAK